MPHRIRVLGLGLVLALGACDAMREGGQELAADTGGGECGAGDWQGYVGQRIDALNDVSLPEGSRVLFPTTPATMDFNSERLNVAVGPDDVISRVYCG